MPEFHSDSLVPPKHGVISSFAMLTWFSIVMVFIGVIAMFALKFDFSRLRGSDHFIGKAREAISAKDWPAAVEALRHVNGKDQDKPGYLRVLADFLESSRTEPSLLDTVLHKLDAKGLMQPGDFIWACRLQLERGNVVAARKAFERISASTASSVEALKLKISILKQEGKTAEAADVEQSLFKNFPNDPEVMLFKASAELLSSFPELQNAALEILWRLAKMPDDNGLKAIRLLGQRKNINTQEATRLLDLVGKIPDVEPADRLRLVSSVMKLDPDRREQLLNAEVRRYAKAGLPVLHQLASWLAQEKEFDRLMALTPADSRADKDMLLYSPDLFPMVALGLAEQAKWSELLALLSKKRQLPVSKVKAASWRALAVKNLKPQEPKEARGHLEEAIREGDVAKDSQALFEAARLADEWGMPDLALKAYEMMAIEGTHQEAAMLEKSMEMAFLIKDSDYLLKVSDRLCKLKPSNPVSASQRDYLYLLTGKNIEAISTKTAEAEMASSHSLLIAALRAYRFHNSTEASALIHEIKDTYKMPPGERAVYAGILAENGDEAKAFELAEKIRPELLLKEEMVFLSKAR